MRTILYATLMGALLVSIALSSAPASSSNASTSSPDTQPGLALESLLKAQLEVADGIEVIVSRVTIPPHSSLPKHWHPGEEFGYVLQGSVVLWQEGKDDMVAKQGDVVKIPLKQVHTAITRDEGATILVFRVHEQGKPERVLAD
jgi:quercetin dioxygenase-like cupin family protein